MTGPVTLAATRWQFPDSSMRAISGTIQGPLSTSDQNPSFPGSERGPSSSWLAPLTSYISDLRRAPLPLQRPQKLLVAALCAAVAISRWFALSTSQIDWDESLFAGAVQEYDVVAQHPHPPGYPLFILFAKVARLVISDDFRSLRAVAALSSLFLFPAVFFLLRELRFPFRIAISGALITSFLPTVWYYGGTALSDVPALCAVVIASALLLAGARNPRAWLAGMFVAGIAGGIRPLHVVIAAVPAIIGAAALRRPRTLVSGCAVFGLVVAASYAGAAFASKNPPWGYLQQIEATTHNIESMDSFNNVSRPPLRKLASMFFVHSHRGGAAGLALLGLAAIGAVEAVGRRRVSIWIVLAMFVPTAIVSWMMLDLTAVTRYGLAYVMLFPVVGAYGIDVLARLSRNETAQNTVMACAVTLVVAATIAWTWPALALVRHQPSPPVAAMRWIRTHMAPAGPQLYLDDSLGYHAGHELPGYDTHFFNKYDQIPPEAYVAGNYCLVDRLTIQPHARHFRFPPGRLEEIARYVYFEVSVIPMDAMIRFGEGWYQDENDGERARAWRWMQRSSTTLFPPIGSNGVLRLRFHIPLNALPRPPQLTVTWNGKVIDESVCREYDNDRRYVLASRADAPNECRIVVDEAGGTKDDPREFGLQLFGVSWERADGLQYGF
jgi:hypothetical protein